MKKKVLAVGIAIAALGVVLALLPTTPVPLPSPEEISDTGIEIVVSDIRIPWAIDFATDGRLFFTERMGNVRVIENGELLKEPVFATEVAKVGEGGMLGLALDPNFDSNHFIYIYYTYVDAKGSIWNKVVQLSEQNNKASEEKVLIDKIPGAALHDGGRIKFGPDSKLYITTGDAGNPGSSQDLKSLAGKILRINPDGSLPADNPFPNSAVYSFGHRNPQGIAWHPDTKELYATEHGPVGNDEINVIKAGMNYGWPVEQCVAEKFVAPIMCYEVTVAPAGAIFYSSNRLPYTNDLFFGTLRGKHVEHIMFDSNGTKAENFLAGFGRIRDIVEGPDGYLYIATSNRDGRGLPASDDDKILRITKAR
ncbi:MAG: PQQ-dependent sugar dehydrogenase [Nitrososphaerales archaeon]